TGGGSAAAGGCETSLTTERIRSGIEALAERTCSAVHIVDDAESSSEPLLELDGAHLQFVNVTIETRRPLTVRLGAASLAHVWVGLVGPVTLRIESSQDVSDLRVATPAAQYGGGVAVEFESVTATGLVLGSEDARFEGELVARRSSLHRA